MCEMCLNTVSGMKKTPKQATQPLVLRLGDDTKLANGRSGLRADGVEIARPRLIDPEG